jgi:hypothetical protein
MGHTAGARDDRDLTLSRTTCRSRRVAGGSYCIPRSEKYRVDSRPGLWSNLPETTSNRQAGCYSSICAPDVPAACKIAANDLAGAELCGGALTPAPD